MTDHDDVRLRLEFLNERLATLKEEKRQHEEAIGEVLDEKSYGKVLAGLLDALRQSGNEALAIKYESALEQFNRCAQALERCNLAGEVNEAAADKMEEAVEDLERVQADVSVWFDSIEKGSA
jgi:hypothetical protein